jgi:dihydrofolate reductase
MRKMIAAMQMSVDSKIEGPEGYADWVSSWSDTFGLLGKIDACVLGANMYPGYEQYWDAIERNPREPLELTGKLPTPEEVEYAHFATSTPHHVLSHKLSSAAWPKTSFVRDASELRSLKEQPGKDIYVVGGAATISSVFDLGLIDELLLTLHPLVAGPGKPLFELIERRHALELIDTHPLSEGRVSLSYRVVNA